MSVSHGNPDGRTAHASVSVGELGASLEGQLEQIVLTVGAVILGGLFLTRSKGAATPTPALAFQTQAPQPAPAWAEHFPLLAQASLAQPQELQQREQPSRWPLWALGGTAALYGGKKLLDSLGTPTAPPPTPAPQEPSLSALLHRVALLTPAPAPATKPETSPPAYTPPPAPQPITKEDLGVVCYQVVLPG